jgi:4a-hydroxytetrahydrobiopterin dehydratase
LQKQDYQMQVSRLDDTSRDAAMQQLPQWTYDADAKGIRRSLRFGDFAEAFGFMAAVATEAARTDHHPEWSNVYSRVVVDLVTHDAGGITELDVALARRMSALAGASISS